LADEPLEQSSHDTEEVIVAPGIVAPARIQELVETGPADRLQAIDPLFDQKAIEQAQGALLRVEFTAEGPLDGEIAFNLVCQQTVEPGPCSFHKASSASPRASSRSLCKATLP